MTEYLLRCEAINLANFIEDTEDLSTIRGGGLLLLNSISFVEEQLRSLLPAPTGQSAVECISSGASVGVFRLVLPEDDPAGHAGAAVRAVELALRRHPEFKHATFAVSAIPSGEFRVASEALLAQVRLKQMQAPTLAFPALDDHAVDACPFDKVRPATESISKAGERVRVSAATKARHDFGVSAKGRAFYATLAGEVAMGMDFVHSFEQLSTNTTKGNLHRKMAIFYADGNSFSAIQTRHCTDAGKQRTWDQQLKEGRRRFLQQLLAAMRAGPASWTVADGRFQIETLLWGGDEFILAVPAWQGWGVANLFFESVGDWSYGGEALTFAAGLVFCHHNAPIHRITRLAKQLARLAKADRSRSRLAYQVLESFDDPGLAEDLVGFRASRYAKEADTAALIILGQGLGGVVEPLRRLKRVIPRGRLVALVLALQRGKTEAAEENQRLLLSCLAKDDRDSLRALESCFGPAPALWFHLAELWDYLGN